MLLHYYYQSRVDRIADLLDETATDFLEQYYGTPTVGAEQRYSIRAELPPRRPGTKAPARS